MKNLRDFLLSRKGWRDEKGNTLAFFERGLEGEPEKDALWFFLDEGLRCGGLQRRIQPEEAELERLLLGCGKRELWELLEKDIEKWRKGE
jgi:hypothetical protein